MQRKEVIVHAKREQNLFMFNLISLSQTMSAKVIALFLDKSADKRMVFEIMA